MIKTLKVLSCRFEMRVKLNLTTNILSYSGDMLFCFKLVRIISWLERLDLLLVILGLVYLGLYPH